MTETIIVWAIVGLVLFFAARSAYLTLSGKNDGCGCASKSCGSSKSCGPSESCGSDEAGRPGGKKP